MDIYKWIITFDHYEYANERTRFLIQLSPSLPVFNDRSKRPPNASGHHAPKIQDSESRTRRSFINEIGLVKGDAGRTRAVSGSLGCLHAESFARRDLRRLVIQSQRLFAIVQSILSSRRSPILRESLLFAPRYTFVDVTNAVTPTCYLRCLYIMDDRSSFYRASFHTICLFFRDKVQIRSICFSSLFFSTVLETLHRLILRSRLKPRDKT